MSEDGELDRLLAECDGLCAEVDGSDREVFARLKTRDGMPIKMGGTYYGAGDNKAWRVVGYGRKHVFCDGMPIKMGGTYYGAGDNKAWRVVDYGRKHVFCDGMPEQGKRLKPEWLMAKPDSWERVTADACKDALSYCAERPWARVAGRNLAHAVRADLVARCKALAGVR
jgi:hypothetical protein